MHDYEVWSKSELRYIKIPPHVQRKWVAEYKTLALIIPDYGRLFTKNIVFSRF